MGFKALEHVEPLDYDFKPYANVSGTITEPSDKAVNRFLKRWWSLVSEITQVGMVRVAEKTKGEPLTDDEAAELVAKAPQTVGEALDAMATLDEQKDENGKTDGELVADKMCEIVAELAGNSLTAADLAAVPYRPRAMFLGWLVGELTSSEKGSAGSNTTLKDV